MTACGGGNAKKDGSEGTAEVKKEAKASKSMKGEWETISPEEDAIKKYKESYLGKTKEIGGFEIGKPKSSKIDEAYWFYGENELENTPTSYIMRFVCGEGKSSTLISTHTHKPFGMLVRRLLMKEECSLSKQERNRTFLHL